MKKYKLLVAAFFMLTFVHSLPLQAQFFALGFSPPTDPNRDWKMMETENFEIIFDQNQKTLALRVASEAERAHSLLTPLLPVSRPQKTMIVIADTSDSANGSATALPRPHIEIYPVLPSMSDSVDYYEDWIRELMIHEYTHITQFEPTYGLMGLIRTIFGSIGRPNIYLPRWYAEGLAVEMESRLSPMGRGRSPYYSALDRSFFEAGFWGQTTIDEINPTTIPSWPRGQRPYYWGHFLMHSLSEAPRTDKKTGPDIYSQLNDAHGGRVPYFINGVPENIFEIDYEELFKHAQLLKKPILQAQWDKLKNAGSQNGERIDFQNKGKSYFYWGARISPDGLKLAAIVHDYNSDTAIKVWERKTPSASFTEVVDPPLIAAKGKDIHGLSWKSDSRTLVYDKAAAFKHYNSYSDLYEITIGEKKSKPRRLTTGLRAREPEITIDGKIIFVQAQASHTALAQVDASGENYKLLYTPKPGERASSPRYKNGKIIFSLKDTSGHEEIKSWDFATQNLSSLTTANKIGESHIAPSLKKSGGFYFAGNQSGVVNIYDFENGKIKPVTNVTTLATSPEYDPGTQEIVYSRLTHEGFILESQPTKERGPLPQIGSVYNYPAAPEKKLQEAKILEESKYSGTSYLWPQFWVPFVSFVPGGVVFDAIFNGTDPLNHHQYLLDLGFDTRARQPRESLSYSNSSLLPFTFTLSATNTFEYLAGLAATEHIVSGVISSQHFLQKHENEWSLNPQWSYRMVDYPGYLFTEVGPGIYLSYSNVDYPFDDQVSPEGGHAFDVGYNYYLPSLGNTSYQSVHASGEMYFSGKPLPERHVIKLRGAAWASPPQSTILSGYQQAGGEYGGLYFSQYFIVRGYPYGEFIGNNIINANFEYRFPIGKVYGGVGTLPAFTKAWHGAFVADAITLDGGYYDNSGGLGRLVSSPLGNFFVGSGAEIKGDFQFFYNWDTTIKFGIYYGFTTKAYGAISYFLGFSSKL